MKKDDLILQEELRQGNKKSFEAVYLQHRDAFINFGKSYPIDTNQLMDIYQDATISLFQNFVMKKLKLKTSTVKTYLFGIGKNLILAELKKESKIYREAPIQQEYEEIIIDSPEETTESRLLAGSFKQLGEKCQEIIRMFYYRNLSVKEIVELSHYKDENTVKSHKSRCMKSLRELVKLEAV